MRTIHLPALTRSALTEHEHTASRPSPHHRAGLAALAAGLLALAGCATVPPEATLADARARLPEAPLALHTDAAARDTARRQADELLAQPLDADAAVRVALLNSPALQALIAEAWATELQAQARGRPANLHLAFERLTHDGGVEFTRALGLSLGDWLLWPARHGQAAQAARAARLTLAADVLGLRQAVRQQWVRTVAAAELAGYHAQVREAADASAELARRMQAVGNFSRLQRARQQAFQAEAVARQQRAVQAATAEREALVRLLGLDADQAGKLRLPERLPALPATPRDAAAVAAAVATSGPGLQAQAAGATQAAAEALAPWAAAAPRLELTLMRSREGEDRSRAFELGLDLPLTDGRSAVQAARLAAGQRARQATLEAGSRLREAYAGYRQAHDLARHQREVLVPLSQTIRDEVLLQYNGMLVGVFELLAEARSQVGAVIAAIEAQRDFWLADAALQAAIDGVPLAGAAPAGPSAPAATGKADAH